MPQNSNNGGRDINDSNANDGPSQLSGGIDPSVLEERLLLAWIEFHDCHGKWRDIYRQSKQIRENDPSGADLRIYQQRDLTVLALNKKYSYVTTLLDKQNEMREQAGIDVDIEKGKREQAGKDIGVPVDDGELESYSGFGDLPDLDF